MKASGMMFAFIKEYLHYLINLNMMVTGRMVVAKLEIIGFMVKKMGSA